MTEAALPMEPAPPPLSAIARLIGVLFSPVKTFQDIARRPTWLAPLLLVIGVTLLVNIFFLVPKMDWEASAVKQAEMMSEKFGVKLKDADVDQMVAGAEKSGPIKAYAGAVLGTIIISLLLGLIYFGVIRLGKGGITYAAAFSVICFASIPTALKMVLTAVAALTSTSITEMDVMRLIPSNPLFFMPETTGMGSMILFGSLDLFTLWSCALTAVGLSACSTWSVGRTALLVAVTFAVFVGGFGGLLYMFLG